MDKPLVSIIMPVFNGALFLERSINSVIKQNYTNWELIIVDDCSIDNSLDIVDLYQGDSRIRVYKNSQNLGISATRNKAIKLSKGVLVALLDQDDEWLENKLSEQVPLFSIEDFNYGLVYSNLKVVLDSGIVISKKRGIDPGLTLESNFEKLFVTNFISSPTAIIRKEVLEEIGLFDETIKWGGDDYDLWLRVAQKYLFGFVPEVLAIRYEHGNNYSVNKKKQTLDTLQLGREFVKKYNLPKALIRKQRGKLFYRLGIELIKQKKIIGLFYIIKGLSSSTIALKEFGKTIKNRI